MKSKIILKSIMIISCLLLSLNMKAQEIRYEDITNNYEWLIAPELQVYSKNMTLLQVGNLDKESKKNKKSGTIEFHNVYMNLEIKEPVVINLEILNANNRPYSHKYKVYERNKNGSFKKKGEWYQGNICWGVNIEMYSSNGEIINDNIWISANPNINYPYSYNINPQGWNNLTSLRDANELLPANIILYPNNTLSINNMKMRTYSHIIGIKSINIMVGTAANVSVRNFTILKPVVF